MSKKVVTIFVMLVGLLLTLMLEVPASVGAKEPPPENTPTLTVKEQAEELLRQYDAALEYELKNGETITDEDGNVVLTGESDVKIKLLWSDTVQKIDEMTARPIEEREKTKEWLKTIEPDTSTIAYHSHTTMPYYGEVVNTERYSTDRNYYTINVDTGKILEVVIIDQNGYSVEPVYSQDELQKKALEYIKMFAPDLDISNLSLRTSQKIGTFFFRWENHSVELSDGTVPFVQVGLSYSGDFLTYVNTLDFAKTDVVSSVLSSPFTISVTGVLLPRKAITWIETYANGGGYWTLESGSVVSYTGGYCYLYSASCPGSFTDKSKFYYKATTTGTATKGLWTPSYHNYKVKVQAFIPWIHATYTAAKYEINLPSGVTYDYYVNQNIYSDTYALVTPNPINTISSIRLRNKASSASYEVAWDEIQVWSDSLWP